MTTMLDQILAHKRTEIRRLNLAALKSQAQDAPPPRDFLAALARLPKLVSSDGSADYAAPAQISAGEEGSVKLIAELKRASPSRGMLAPHLDLFQLAQIYAAGGAAAISVLTDERFFLGSLDTLRVLRANSPLPHKVRGAEGGGLPLLRKDFILAAAQIYETRAAGADAVLLIAAALPEDGRLADLHALALSLGLTPLVEVHDQADLARALRLPDLKLVGINNRDLKTFTVSLDATAVLRPLVPPGIRVVSESGIFTSADMARLAALQVDAALVGEALVTAPDIGAKVRELAGQ
jgi:indole-3-glycerol phosphate synthase